MSKTIAQLAALLVCLNTFGLGATSLELHDARRQTMRISAALLRGTVPDRRAIDSLTISMDRMCRSDSSLLPPEVSSRKSWRDDLQRLSFWYQLFRVAYDAQCSPESLRTEFRRYSSSFHSMFCDHFLAEARRQQSTTVLLFAPSISCDCTMRMSLGYERLLDSVTTEMGSGVSLIMIDTVFREDLSLAFGVRDVPAIVLLSHGNREARRWVREEAIGEQLRAAVRALL
jgi:hypothetical protein